MWLTIFQALFMQSNSYSTYISLVNGGKVPKKPGGCNCNHIPKVLEHPTGLAKQKPSHKPPVPSPHQAPITLEPDSSVKKKPGGIGRDPNAENC